MSPYKLAKIIDREKELQLFRDLLQERTKPRLVLFQDKSGTGKSWLLELLEQEAKANYPAVGTRIVLEASTELRWLVSKISDGLGAVGAPLTRYEKLARARSTRDHRPFGLPEPPRIDINVSVANSTVIESSIKGGDVIMPWPEGYDRAAETACLDALLDDLRDLSRRRTAVLLIDQYEKANREIRRWLDRALLTRILDDADPFGALIIVVASNDDAFFDVASQLGPRRGDLIHKTALSRWEDRHIEQYFRQVGVPNADQEPLRAGIHLGWPLSVVSLIASERRNDGKSYDEPA